MKSGFKAVIAKCVLLALWFTQGHRFMGSESASDRDKMSPKCNGSKPPGSPSPSSSKQEREAYYRGVPAKSPKADSDVVTGSCSPNNHQKDKTTTPKTGSPFKMAKKDKRGPGLDFNEYTQLSQRLTKSMYYAKKMPSVSRPSFPLTGKIMALF